VLADGFGALTFATDLVARTAVNELRQTEAVRGAPIHVAARAIASARARFAVVSATNSLAADRCTALVFLACRAEEGVARHRAGQDCVPSVATARFTLANIERAELRLAVIDAGTIGVLQAFGAEPLCVAMTACIVAVSRCGTPLAAHVILAGLYGSAVLVIEAGYTFVFAQVAVLRSAVTVTVASNEWHANVTDAVRILPAIAVACAIHTLSE
jgi:hypothetical protein